jgi:hypothetical protein
MIDERILCFYSSVKDFDKNLSGKRDERDVKLCKT